MNTTIRYRWVILGLVVYCQLAQAISFQSIPPIIGILVQAFTLSYAQAGGLMSFSSLPRLLLGIPSGILVDRFGTKRIGIGSLLAISLGTVLVAFGSSYWFLGLGRFISGMGTTFLNVVTLQGMTAWFQGKESGLSMGFFHTAMPLGTILSLNVVGVSASIYGWRATIFFIFVLCGLALILFGLFYHKRPVEMTKSPAPLKLSILFKREGWGIWLVGSSWMLLNAAIIPYFTYAPDYFVTLGKSISEAGRLASYPMLASIFLAPLFGLVIDRVGRKKFLILVGFAGSAIFYYLIPRFPQHAAFFAVAIGVCAAVQPTAIFSLPAEFLPQSAMGVGFGIISTSAALGMGIGPYVAGSLRDLTGGYLWSFNAMAAFALLGIIPIILLTHRSLQGSPRISH